MTEQQGLFTVMTALHLTTEQRAQLEHLVHQQRADLADVVSQIVADYPPAGQPPPPDQQLHTIPTRIYLTPEQRATLAQMARAHAVDLAALVSQSVGAYLDRLPPVPLASEPQADHGAELRKRRSDLARLRARRDAAGQRAPAWLNDYIAELEEEIRELEQAI